MDRQPTGGARARRSPAGQVIDRYDANPGGGFFAIGARFGVNGGTAVPAIRVA